MNIIEKIDEQLDEANFMIKEIGGSYVNGFRGHNTASMVATRKEAKKYSSEKEAMSDLKRHMNRKFHKDYQIISEAKDPMMKYNAQSAAGKIMGMDVFKKGSVRDLLIKQGAIKSVTESMKFINKMAEIILKEME